MSKPMVTQNRESDGKFALKLQSNTAVLRDQMRETARRQREQEIIAENAEWCKRMGFDPNDAVGIFA